MIIISLYALQVENADEIVDDGSENEKVSISVDNETFLNLMTSLEWPISGKKL